MGVGGLGVGGLETSFINDRKSPLTYRFETIATCDRYTNYTPLRSLPSDGPSTVSRVRRGQGETILSDENKAAKTKRCRDLFNVRPRHRAAFVSIFSMPRPVEQLRKDHHKDLCVLRPGTQEISISVAQFLSSLGLDVTDV